jgi:hypothetical protein
MLNLTKKNSIFFVYGLSLKTLTGMAHASETCDVLTPISWDGIQMETFRFSLLSV